MGIRQSEFDNAVTFDGGIAVTGAVAATGKISTTDTTYYIDSIWYSVADLCTGTTGAADGLENDLTGGGKPPVLDDQIYPGLALATTDQWGALWKPPINIDVTKAINFYVQVQFADAATTSDALALALKYTNFTLGTTAISALPATTTGVTNAATVTCTANELDDVMQNIGPFAIAAGTFTAVGMLGWAFTTTLTAFTDDQEVMVHGVEIQFARTYS